MRRLAIVGAMLICANAQAQAINYNDVVAERNAARATAKAAMMQTSTSNDGIATATVGGGGTGLTLDCGDRGTIIILGGVNSYSTVCNDTPGITSGSVVTPGELNAARLKAARAARDAAKPEKPVTVEEHHDLVIRGHNNTVIDKDHLAIDPTKGAVTGSIRTPGAEDSGTNTRDSSSINNF